jgi:hypothetical protein
MTVRTFKQCGLGIGVDPISIIAKINGEIVFEGEIPTVDIPLPELPDQVDPEISFNNSVFSWEGVVEFTGAAQVEIIVEGPGTLILSDTLANYVIIGNTAPSADIYGSFYSYTEGNIIITDPYSDPKIDDVEIERLRNVDPASPLDGQWWYTIDGESTFTGTLNISAGKLALP